MPAGGGRRPDPDEGPLTPCGDAPAVHAPLHAVDARMAERPGGHPDGARAGGAVPAQSHGESGRTGGPALVDAQGAPHGPLTAGAIGRRDGDQMQAGARAAGVPAHGAPRGAPARQRLPVDAHDDAVGTAAAHVQRHRATDPGEGLRRRIDDDPRGRVGGTGCGRVGGDGHDGGDTDRRPRCSRGGRASAVRDLWMGPHAADASYAIRPSTPPPGWAETTRAGVSARTSARAA